MKQQVWISVGAILAVTLLVVVGAISLLRNPSIGADTAGAAGTASTFSTVESTAAEDETIGQADAPSDSGVPAGIRPECPAPTIGGVELPCLGADEPTGVIDSDQIVVVSVWAHWCEPCRTELPALQDFADSHPEYTVVGVHGDPDGAAGAHLLNELGVSLPSYQDSNATFSTAFALPPVVPVTVVLRGEEKIAVIPKVLTTVEEFEGALQEVL